MSDFSNSRYPNFRVVKESGPIPVQERSFSQQFPPSAFRRRSETVLGEVTHGTQSMAEIQPMDGVSGGRRHSIQEERVPTLQPPVVSWSVGPTPSTEGGYGESLSGQRWTSSATGSGLPSNYRLSSHAAPVETIDGTGQEQLSSQRLKPKNPKKVLAERFQQRQQPLRQLQHESQQARPQRVSLPSWRTPLSPPATNDLNVSHFATEVEVGPGKRHGQVRPTQSHPQPQTRLHQEPAWGIPQPTSQHYPVADAPSQSTRSSFQGPHQQDYPDPYSGDELPIALQMNQQFSGYPYHGVHPLGSANRSYDRRALPLPKSLQTSHPATSRPLPDSISRPKSAQNPYSQINQILNASKHGRSPSEPLGKGTSFSTVAPYAPPRQPQPTSSSPPPTSRQPVLNQSRLSPMDLSRVIMTAPNQLGGLGADPSRMTTVFPQEDEEWSDVTQNRLVSRRNDILIAPPSSSSSQFLGVDRDHACRNSAPSALPVVFDFETMNGKPGTSLDFSLSSFFNQKRHSESPEREPAKNAVVNDHQSINRLQFQESTVPSYRTPQPRAPLVYRSSVIPSTGAWEGHQQQPLQSASSSLYSQSSMNTPSNSDTSTSANQTQGMVLSLSSTAQPTPSWMDSVAPIPLFEEKPESESAINQETPAPLAYPSGDPVEKLRLQAKQFSISQLSTDSSSSDHLLDFQQYFNDIVASSPSSLAAAMLPTLSRHHSKRSVKSQRRKRPQSLDSLWFSEEYDLDARAAALESEQDERDAAEDARWNQIASLLKGRFIHADAPLS